MVNKLSKIKYYRIVIGIIMVLIMCMCGCGEGSGDSDGNQVDSDSIQNNNQTASDNMQDEQSDIVDYSDNGDNSASAYRFVCTDQKGDPVPGVKIQICTSDACTMQTTDDNGEIIYSGEPMEYDIHVYRIPDGYELQSEKDFKTDAEYGSYDIILK